VEELGVLRKAFPSHHTVEAHENRCASRDTAASGLPVNRVFFLFPRGSTLLWLMKHKVYLLLAIALFLFPRGDTDKLCTLFS